MAADVHVQQVAGAGPLVAPGRLPLRPRAPRESVPAKHLPDGRVREAGRGRDQAWAPAGAAAAGADPCLQRRSELARRATGSARAIAQAGAAAAVLLAGRRPAMPPAMRGRGRDAEGRRGGLDAHSPFDCQHERQAAGQSELGVTVKRHPGPSFGRESWQTHSLKGGPDVLSGVHNVCRRDS